MPIDVKLPPSEGVESADIAEVYISEGDVIEKDQAITTEQQCHHAREAGDKAAARLPRTLHKRLHVRGKF